MLARLKDRFAAKTVVLPYIYDLKKSGPAVATLREQGGPWIVLSWMYPRAAYWTLRAFGIQGTQMESGKPTPIVAGTRTIECVNLNDFSDAAEAESEIETLLRTRGLIDDSSQAPASADKAIQVLEEATTPRWYPVVDTDACGNCLECLNFCLFGVYSVDNADSLFVEIPDACRNGCPACSRVCPQGAIMFPEHTDPAIAGGTVTTADAVEEEDKKTATSEQASAAKETSLDTLVDELDQFDG